MTISTHPTMDHPCPSGSGWNRLPTECVQIVIEALTPNPGTLASLLQVNRQLFFLVVPVLYYDPFKTLLDLTHLQNDSIRLCCENAPIDGYSTKSISASDCIRFNDLNGDPKAVRYEIHGAMAWSTRDWDQRNERMASHLQREVSLLATLFWTSVQEFCTRYPSIKSFYYPSSLQSSWEWTAQKMDMDKPFNFSRTDRRRRRPIVDFAKYSDRGIVWTSQEYLRHVRVLDLVRISTRQPYKNLHEKVFHSIEKVSILVKMMPACGRERRRALLDKLSGGLVDSSGNNAIVHDHESSQGSIWNLRIPAHRLRTYQLSQDRVSRLSKKKPGKQTITLSSSLDIEGPSTELYQRRKPYGFTLERLKHLRRLEVCGLNNNLQFWETLERVVASLQRSREYAPTSDGACARKRGMIREFSLEVQGDLGTECRLDKILEHLNQLEVLEIYTSNRHRIHIDLCGDLSWGQNLKSLKIGLLQHKDLPFQESFAFLGSFRNLVSLAIMVDRSPLVFEWMIDRKDSRRQRLNKQQQPTLRSPSDIRATAQLRDDSDHNAYDINDCLPNLRHLSITNCLGDMFLGPANSAAEAFGDQLQELVLQLKSLDRAIPPIGFLHPFRNLARLALRGPSLINFFKSKSSISLAECCPSLKKLALQVQVDNYNRRIESLQLDTVVETLLLITTLECLYFEQSWLFNDTQLLRIASDSPRLRKIGCWLLPRMTMEGIAQTNDVLVAKRYGGAFPLKPAGLFRLIGRTDVSQEDHWVMSSFDPDRND